MFQHLALRFYSKIEYNTKENGGFLMQYLKYEVRKNIVEEALKEFKQMGTKALL